MELDGMNAGTGATRRRWWIVMAVVVSVVVGGLAAAVAFVVWLASADDTPDTVEGTAVAEEIAGRIEELDGVSSASTDYTVGSVTDPGTSLDLEIVLDPGVTQERATDIVVAARERIAGTPLRSVDCRLTLGSADVAVGLDFAPGRWASDAQVEMAIGRWLLG